MFSPLECSGFFLQTVGRFADVVVRSREAAREQGLDLLYRFLMMTIERRIVALIRRKVTVCFLMTHFPNFGNEPWV